MKKKIGICNTKNRKANDIVMVPSVFSTNLVNWVNLFKDFNRVYDLNHSIHAQHITEDDKNIIVTVPMKGFTKEDIKIIIDFRNISILASTKDKQASYIFGLFKEVDRTKVQAIYINDVLTVTIPKVVEKAITTIKVQ